MGIGITIAPLGLFAITSSGDIAIPNNIGTSRARHSVRAVVGLAKFGAHGVTRPTLLPMKMIVQCQHDPRSLSGSGCGLTPGVRLAEMLGHRLRAGTDMKLFVDVPDVRMHRRVTHFHLIGDFLVEKSFRQQI